MKTLRTTFATLTVLCAGQALAHSSIAELSVYDRTQARRLPVYWHEGRAYVVGKPGNEYQVSVRNRLREEVLAIVSVDGINVITGQSADPSQRGYVVGVRDTLDIRGWRKDMAQTAAFYFTSLADSYAARTGRPEDVGVIGVALFRKKTRPPVAIGQGGASGDGAEARNESPGVGTGHGRRENSPATSVVFERATITPAEVLALYYDSYENLLARGVIRESRRPAPHRPRPFPGFVPDPSG